MSIYVPGKVTLRQTYIGVDDPDAAAYIAAVEAADEIASPGIGGLETATKVAIHSFVKGCKNDGIWPAIKASCILAGAKTTNGALVPLVGTAPTPYNFDLVGDTDYDRKTGLAGDGSTKQLDSGYAGSSLLPSNHHLSVYATTVAESSGARTYIGESSAPSVLLYRSGNSLIMRSATSSTAATGLSATAAGFIGFSRSSVLGFTARAGSTDAPVNDTSVSIGSNNIFTHSRGGSLYGSACIAFYSIGESLPDGPTKTGLELLDERVSALINAFGVAIP